MEKKEGFKRSRNEIENISEKNNIVGENILVVESGSSFIFGLLKEIWLFHIFTYFKGDIKTKKRIRSVCKLFYHLINQITKWEIKLVHLEEYLKFYEKEKREDWKPSIYKIIKFPDLIGKPMLDYSILKKLPQSVRILDLDDSYIKDSDLCYLSNSYLEKIILNYCYVITNEGIKNLSTSLKSLEIQVSLYDEGNKLTRDIMK